MSGQSRRERSSPIGEADRSREGHGHTALVTGASSGIGKSIAELLAAKGYDVIIVARRTERLEQMQTELQTRFGVRVHPFTADLAQAQTPSELVKRTTDAGITVDFLVNNAGYSLPGVYHETTWAEQERYLRVIGSSVLELTHHLLPEMVERRWGRVINVSSMACLFTGSPNMAIYAGAKAMTRQFTEAIATETAGTGVNCTVSIPGITETEIFVAAGVDDAVRAFPGMSQAMMSPHRVAREAYDAVMAGRRSIIHGRRHHAVAALLTYTPGASRRYLSKKMMEPITPT